MVDSLQEAVRPNYSISQAGDRNAECGNQCGTQVSHTTAASRVSSTRVRQEAQHAALLERAASLKRKQELEYETARIQAEKEELEMKTALAESLAKLKVLKEYERSEDSYSYHTPVQKLQFGNVKKEKVHIQPSMLHSQPPPSQSATSHRPNTQVDRGDDILKVMQRQNVITELLVKQQQLSQLPTKDIPVFKGDALQFKPFIRAFEHAIDQKTDNEQDKLYFLEQYTAGEPQELVRSCTHMTQSKGYLEAKRLLHKHYGDELRIASAYIDKALTWPQVKSEDGKALSAYAMFLIGCLNTMMDIEYLDKMDNPTNLQTMVE